MESEDGREGCVRAWATFVVLRWQKLYLEKWFMKKDWKINYDWFRCDKYSGAWGIRCITALGRNSRSTAFPQKGLCHGRWMRRTWTQTTFLEWMRRMCVNSRFVDGKSDATVARLLEVAECRAILPIRGIRETLTRRTVMWHWDAMRS